MTVPTIEPPRVTAGDTLAWTRSLPDYPASAGWVLHYRLINAAGKIDITASAAGDDHAVNVAATTSAAWAAGTYTRVAHVVNGSERSTNRHWARSCHEFKFYEALLSPTPTPAASHPTPAQVTTSDPTAPVTKPQESSIETNGLLSQGDEEELCELLVLAVSPAARQQAARDLVIKAITRLSQTRGETWIQKARLRPFIQRMDPTFNESSFGFRSFIEMMASMSDIVESRKGKFDHELRLRGDAVSLGL